LGTSNLKSDNFIGDGEECLGYSKLDYEITLKNAKIITKMPNFS
jgi:hypothetical protein